MSKSGSTSFLDSEGVVSDVGILGWLSATSCDLSWTTSGFSTAALAGVACGVGFSSCCDFSLGCSVDSWCPTGSINSG